MTIVNMIKSTGLYTMSLTTACSVRSNVHSLSNIHWVRYLTAVDPILSNSSAVHTYHRLTSICVEIQLSIVVSHSTSIGKQPFPTTLRRSATSSEISYTTQSSIIFTNVLQGHDTVVLVYCTIEWKPDITCTCEVWIFVLITTLYYHNYWWKTAFWSLTPKFVSTHKFANFELRLQQFVESVLPPKATWS